MKVNFLITLGILTITSSCIQDSSKEEKVLSQSSARVIESERIAFQQKLDKEIIFDSLRYSYNAEKFSGAMWGIYAFHQKNEKSAQIIRTAINEYESLSYWDRYQLLLCIKGVYPTEFLAEIAPLLAIEKGEKHRVLLLNILQKEEQYQNYLSKDTSLYYQYFQSQSEKRQSSFSFQDLDRLLEIPALKGKKNIIMCLDKNREKVGKAYIQKKDGEFLSEGNDVKTYSYLGRSATNAPSVLTNGNTPTGLMKILGTDKSDNVFIGPSPTLISAVPYESGVENFVPNSHSKEWSEEVYASLLGDEFKHEASLYESYWAGKCGRSEMIIHGSTINPSFFKGKDFYPLTPSLGCMTAKELWDDQTGEVQESTQLELINDFNKQEGELGYVLILNIEGYEEI
ncbi:hypothetical protein [Sediminitomix flava]|uniref:Uncharacterized protein n=1 Tax=Sediminitomix flava TaxID=379075 RepID=A0A315ZE52_SEDFL|nr:hypothetical protein [Sediminitomix flava]PWJ43811.1 hypothetical protein BC781_101157 [Sediminitomix flava]